MHKKRIYSDALKILIVIFIINFLAFTQYYYKKVNFNSLLESFIIFSNCIFSYFIKFARIVTKNGLTSSNIKVILIILGSIYILDKYEIIELLHGISTLQFKDFKIETTKLGTIHDNAKKEVDRLESEPKKMKIKSMKVKIG